MSNTYNFIINSFQEVEDLRFFINFLHSKKKKIVFFCQKFQINEKLKISINKNKINKIFTVSETVTKIFETKTKPAP